MGDSPGHTWPPPCPSRLSHFPAWFLSSNKILAFAVKTHQHSSSFQQPKFLPDPKAMTSHSWPHPANHGAPLPLLLACATGSSTARCFRERWV